MVEPMHQLREHIDADFDAHDIERGLSGLQGKLRRRQTVKLAGSAALLVMLGVAGLQLQPTPQLAGLRTDDGSLATRLSSETELKVEQDEADHVELALARGKGHFEVTKNPRRKYRVRAGEVEVEVLGTAFDVTRRNRGAEVHVDHGLVRVRWRDGQTLLRAGEHGVFPPPVPQAVAQAPAPAPAPVAAVAPVVVDKPAVRKDEREKWRSLASAGKHREAFGSLGHRAVRDLEGLLLASDAARLSGHPREAAQYLETLVRDYPGSAPARLAAFTLGRLQLHELNDPKLAARSFARAYALDPRGPLAEDALAREAEAYRLAGQRGRAAEVAARYLAHFPDGARHAEMAGYLAP